ncbi:uncharacterized protein MYCFIDRAFT_169838 [Pseudocercospora fijiensis CIRAD86]|uniref:Uncharacterized protein n=1 Tax=Pseudocercospora fijiensis (strain CIRAD86) TaxID=383855 RepID=N1Q6P6_PSEFD|nr:uncharacterized protein MYCFIDRAFT_169838 [Pseudocercospora fijiensis CIRAD86]EME88164.1 hypothetical protein MYCFIDRAFT_169838 [Pseudocercospora fijiensis CIRAD86]
MCRRVKDMFYVRRCSPIGPPYYFVWAEALAFGQGSGMSATRQDRPTDLHDTFIKTDLKTAKRAALLLLKPPADMIEGFGVLDWDEGRTPQFYQCQNLTQDPDEML